MKLVRHKTLNALADYELLVSVDIYDESHNIEKIQRKFIWRSTNAFLNNSILAVFN